MLFGFNIIVLFIDLNLIYLSILCEYRQIVFKIYVKKYYQKEFKEKASKSDKYHINQLYFFGKSRRSEETQTIQLSFIISINESRKYIDRYKN